MSQIKSNEKFATAVDSAVSILASRVFSALPSMLQPQKGEPIVFYFPFFFVTVEGGKIDVVLVSLSVSSAELVRECLSGLASVHFTSELALRIGPLLLRMSVFCLSQADSQLDRAALLLFRRLLVLPEDSSDEQRSKWETIQHAALVSLSQIPTRSVVLQASVALFSSLSFANPELAVYSAFAGIFSRAFLSESLDTRSTALTCFRVLLESAFRARDSPLFNHVCMLVGACGADFVQSCCLNQTHVDEELKILVFVHAIAGATGSERRRKRRFRRKERELKKKKKKKKRKRCSWCSSSCICCSA